MRPRSRVPLVAAPQLAGLLPAHHVAVLEALLEFRAELLPARPRFVGQHVEPVRSCVLQNYRQERPFMFVLHAAEVGVLLERREPHLCVLRRQSAER